MGDPSRSQNTTRREHLAQRKVSRLRTNATETSCQAGDSPSASHSSSRMRRNTFAPENKLVCIRFPQTHCIQDAIRVMTPNQYSSASCGISWRTYWGCISDFLLCQQGFIEFLSMNIEPAKAASLPGRVKGLGKLLPNQNARLKDQFHKENMRADRGRTRVPHCLPL